MKKLSLAFMLSIILSGLNTGYAQNNRTDGNPFARYGLNVQVATYSENQVFHDRLKVVEIGSIKYDVHKQKIVGFINTKDSVNYLAPEIVAMQPDPHCEKYYSISPYVYALNNPIKFVDPDGRDVWEVNENGTVVNRIEDNTQDAFFRVDIDGNRLQGDNTSVTFKYGTVKESNIIIKTNQGNETMKLFSISGDKNAMNAFNFLIGGGGENQVEWGHVKIGTESSGKNFVGASNDESGSAVGDYTLQYGYTIRESNHNHPSGGTTSSLSDVENAGRISAKFPKATFNIYGKPFTPVPFNKNSPRIVPNKPGSKVGKLVYP